MIAVGLAIAARPGSASTSPPSTTGPQPGRAEYQGRFAKKLQTYLEPAVPVCDEVGYLPLDRRPANMVFSSCPAATSGGR